jgi:hypothetical protein
MRTTAFGLFAATALVAAGAAAKPPAWDLLIGKASRFKELKAFGGEAVLDRETGLVWQKNPAATASQWSTAMTICLRTPTGGRGGWRLPRFEELATLIDPESGATPAAHPFDAPPDDYWTATTYYTDSGPASDLVLLLDSEDGATIFTAKDSTGTQIRVWCVRGGAGVDDQ